MAGSTTLGLDILPRPLVLAILAAGTLLILFYVIHSRRVASPIIDLSLLAPTLGVADAASLDNVPLPSHDHLLTTRNGDQPEWWNVVVIPVTSAKGLAAVEHAKDYASVKALEDCSAIELRPDHLMRLFERDVEQFALGLSGAALRVR